MEFLAKLSNLSSILDFVITEAKKIGFEEKETSFIELACEEAIVNIIYHAYKEQNSDHNKIIIEIRKIKEGIEIEVLDFGIAFSPKMDNFQVDVMEPIEKRKVGGLGIFFMKNLTDKLEYSRNGEQNKTTLTFFFDSPKRKY